MLTVSFCSLLDSDLHSYFLTLYLFSEKLQQPVKYCRDELRRRVSWAQSQCTLWPLTRWSNNLQGLLCCSSRNKHKVGEEKLSQKINTGNPLAQSTETICNRTWPANTKPTRMKAVPHEGCLESSDIVTR